MSKAVKTINVLNILIIIALVPIIARAPVSTDLRNAAWLLLLVIVLVTIIKFNIWPRKKKRI